MSLYDKLINSDNKLGDYKSIVEDYNRSTRTLTSATLEITPVCNFSCPFCYARVSPKELLERGEKVLRFDFWKNIIDRLADMKVYSLTLTGGECTLHPDFKEIYKYAYDKGFSISMLSNGSAITDELLNLFKSCPPGKIAITMYGSCPETYEKVCGNADFYYRVTENIKKLKHAGIELLLQCTVNKDNIDDFVQIGKFAQELDLELKCTMDFVNTRRCTDEITEENTVSKAQFIDAINTILDKKLNERKASPIKESVSYNFVEPPKKGLMCGAGRSACTFNYKGQMVPCVTFAEIKIDTVGRDLNDCWRELVAACDEVPLITECANCIHRSQCRLCVAYHYYDVGEYGVPSPRFCYKKLHPEKAKQIEEFYEKNGYLTFEMYDD